MKKMLTILGIFFFAPQRRTQGGGRPRESLPLKSPFLTGIGPLRARTGPFVPERAHSCPQVGVKADFLILQKYNYNVIAKVVVGL